LNTEAEFAAKPREFAWMMKRSRMACLHAAFAARFVDFDCRTGGQHSAALSAQQLSVK
jgi:hypothetical protein